MVCVRWMFGRWCWCVRVGVSCLCLCVLCFVFVLFYRNPQSTQYGEFENMRVCAVCWL